MRHVSSILAAFAATALLGACATTGSAPAPKENRLQYMSAHPTDFARLRERRAALLAGAEGGEMARLRLRADPDIRLRQNVSILDDPAAESRLKLVVKELLDNHFKGLPELNIVLTDSEAYNAFAVSTGQIVIPLGILKTSQSLDELYFVIAHELAHILKDHFRAAENRKQRKNTIMAGLAVAQKADSLANDGQRPDLLGEAQYTAGLAIEADRLLAPSWNRAQEREADELGLDLLIEANYSSIGAIDMFDRLVDEERQAKEAREKYCGKTGILGGLIPSGLQRAFQSDQDVPPGANDPSCSAINQAVSYFFRKHPTAKARRKAIEAYRDAFYGDRATVLLKSFGDNNYLNVISPNGALARTVRARQGLAALDAGDIEKAARLIEASLESEDDLLPEARYARYRLRLVRGERAAALKDLELVVDDGSAPRKFYTTLAKERASDGDFGDAVDLLEKSADKFGYPDLDYPEKLKYQVLGDRIADAWATNNACRKSQFPGTAERCETIAEELGLKEKYDAYLVEENAHKEKEKKHEEGKSEKAKETAH